MSAGGAELGEAVGCKEQMVLEEFFLKTSRDEALRMSAGHLGPSEREHSVSQPQNALSLKVHGLVRGMGSEPVSEDHSFQDGVYR